MLLAAAGAAALLLALAPSAFADYVTPESGSGSQNAEDIDTLYKITLYIAIVIFLLVEGTLIWSLVRYRHRRGGPEPAQIRGNAQLELGWTIGAATILVILTAITFIKLGDIRNPPASDPNGLRVAQGVQFASTDQPSPPGGSKSLQIGVNGQQYLWRYDYPGKSGELFSYYDLVVPVHTTVTLKITSQDVAHSWWVPKLGGKMDGLPGHTNETWFKVTKPGVYRGVCAELCGEGHADMRTAVHALPVDQYQAWAERQRAGIKQSQELLAGDRRRRDARESQGAGQAAEASGQEQ